MNESSDLAAWIKVRMAELGLEQQKELAGRIHDRLPDLKLDTVTTKLSKLLNADQEGERFFASAPERSGALAAALEVDLATLERHREAAASLRTLVLDPDLPPSVRAELADRCVAVERRGLVRCVTAVGPEPEKALRDTARQVHNPLLVLADKRDAKPFELLELPWSKLRWAKRAHVLDAAPELLPEPPPAPPKLFSENGDPLIPLTAEDLDRLKVTLPRRYGAESPFDEMWKAHERGEAHPFTLTQAVAHIPFAPNVDYSTRAVSCVDRHDLPAEALFGTQQTFVWTEGPRIVAHGPHLEKVRRAFEPWHSVEAPAWLGLAAELDDPDLNPWQLLRDYGKAGSARFEAWEATVEPTAPWTKPGEQARSEKATWEQRHGGDFARRLDGRARHRAEVLLKEVVRDGDGLVGRLGAPAEAARATLAALADRPVFDGATNVRLALMLRHAVERRLEVLPVREPDLLRVVADFGGPKLWSFRIRRLAGRVEPFRHVGGGVYEGGDVLLSICSHDADLPWGRDTLVR